MSISSDIINLKTPDLEFYIQNGDSIDDIDEYGFTPLIEAAITRQLNIAKLLIDKGANVNKADVTGRTPLHWAVDNADLEMTKLLLQHNADANAYSSAGLSALVYPILRAQPEIKHLLYQHHAKLDFAMDFIYAKLIGHRFELEGDVDILNAQGESIELDFEGFILEFTVAVIKDSLRKFTSSYSTRHLRSSFSTIYEIIDALSVADDLLKFQHSPNLSADDHQKIKQLIQIPLLILPAASRGHAMCFVRYQDWWAKIDRGENSQREGTVNIYRMHKPEALNLNFVLDFLYKKQNRQYFHQSIHSILGLERLLQLPIPAQISGNCSWANIQAVLPTAFVLLHLQDIKQYQAKEALNIYEQWIEWDKDRALDECIQRFYAAEPRRKASFASILATVLFRLSDDEKREDLARAEKILPILMLADYYYILKSYLDIYCIKRLTRKGNNLLKLLDNCGINPNIGVNPIASGNGSQELE